MQLRPYKIIHTTIFSAMMHSLGVGKEDNVFREMSWTQDGARSLTTVTAKPTIFRICNEHTQAR